MYKLITTEDKALDFPKSVPSVGLVDGEFVDEDVVAGTPGSLIPAQWGNAVTDEILNVIESAGLTPDEDNNAQLLAAITAKINNAIPASPPDASTTDKGLVELATSLEAQTGTDPQRAVTPAALTSRTATDTRTGLVELATDLEVQAGTDTQRAITPSGLSARTATETRTGVAAVATQPTVNAGTDDTTIVTPKKLRLGFAISFAANGYIAFPTWMGGLIIQWGQAAASTTTTAFNYPFAFPTEVYQVLCSDAGVATMEYVAATSVSNSQFNARCNSGTSGFSFLAIGR
ncbi:gp53-like domain-containing protein [Pseudomonas mediterranea]